MPTALQNLYSLPQSSRTRPARAANSKTVSDETAKDRDTVTLDGRKASWLTDALAVAQFVGSGILYKDAADAAAKYQEKHPPLADAPKVKLEDPFLILPGWTTLPEKFDNLVTHLLKNPENGERAVYLKEGKPYSDKSCTEETAIQDSDKVFVAVYDDVLSPPHKTAPQIAQAVELVKASKGEKVDVLGYSMGGIAARKMLDDGLQTLDQVAFLGTSHNGSRFASLASYVIHRDINFAINLAGVSAAHLPAMEWMMPYESDNPQSNPKLHDLNSNLDRQKEHCSEMLNISSDGLATISRSWGGAIGGDGLVSHKSSNLEDVPRALLHGRGNKQHGQLPSDTEAFLQMKEYFGWGAA